jgi:putative oxidoreductase
MSTTMSPPAARSKAQQKEGLGFLVPLGRIMFSAIFLMTVMSHFAAGSVEYATQAGVPRAAILVPASGVVAVLGGLSVLLGFRARLGALLLMAFLIPVTYFMHNFWTLPDPATVQLQQAMFFKNVSMLGGALLIAYFGAGPFSLDAVFRKGGR